MMYINSDEGVLIHFFCRSYKKETKKKNDFLNLTESLFRPPGKERDADLSVTNSVKCSVN